MKRDPNLDDVCAGHPVAMNELAELRDKVDFLTIDWARESDANKKLRAERKELAKLLPGNTYLDPADGGEVNLLAQFRRMAMDAERYRTQLAGDSSAKSESEQG